MDSVLDFAKAAAPWVAMGVTAAVLAVRHASKGAKKKKCEKFGGDCGTEGMCLGMCFGVCLGTAFDNTAIGISLGMLLGLVIGTYIPKNPEDGEK